jgi:hypothetical protein
MATKVIGTKVAVKMTAHMLTSTMGTEYASANCVLAGEKHKLNALTIIIAFMKKNKSGHRNQDVLGVKFIVSYFFSILPFKSSIRVPSNPFEISFDLLFSTGF